MQELLYDKQKLLDNGVPHSKLFASTCSACTCIEMHLQPFWEASL